MKPLAFLLVAALIVAPVALVMPAAAARDPLAIISQGLGLLALLAIAWAQVLATRWRPLEGLFGGLDRIYVWHKWLGVSAMAALLLHDTIDAELDENGSGSLLHELGETLGELSLYGLLILVTITVVTVVPYQWWRWTHRFIGAFFIAGFMHFLLVHQVVDLASPLGLYVILACALGTAAYLYNIVPFGRDRQQALPYRVAALTGTGGAAEITMEPLGAPLRHRAGEFCLVSFDTPELEERHPFTISSAPAADGRIAVTVKPLGDYTEDLPRGLKEGAAVSVIGPYGRFRLRTQRPQIWIAAGIGITPFAAWVDALPPEHPPVHLFYTARGADNAPHLQRLRAKAATDSAFILHFIDSAAGERLTASLIRERVAEPLTGMDAAYCGPKPLREQLLHDLAAAGLPARRFRYEEFEFRSGIGLGRLATWLWRRGEPYLERWLTRT